MIPIVFDYKKLEQCRLYAEANPLSYDESVRLRKSFETANGADDILKVYGVNMPISYFVMYTIEQLPLGWYRVLSCSCGVTGRLPSPHTMIELMRVFGFQHELESEEVRKKVFKQHGQVTVMELHTAYAKQELN